jgi:uncharacterized protein YndB with AHSA1/START domain
MLCRAAIGHIAQVDCGGGGRGYNPSRKDRIMWGVLLVLLYFGLALLAAVIVMQPDRFAVTREAVIGAPPARVFALINDLRNWEGWSPWAQLDPEAQKSYFGPPAGAGAGFEWSGNKKIGAGSMTIVTSVPNERIDLRLDMRKPFKASSEAFFRLSDVDGHTRVAWTMTGRNTLLSKVMNLVMNYDKVVGGQFEVGLANLNALASGAGAV